MKSNLSLLVVFLTILFSASFAQENTEANPFAKYGYTPKIATLSKGKYVEFFDRDTIVHIGNVVFNTMSKTIVGFIEQDTIQNEATLQPDLVSRWLSPDPLASEFPSWSPYNFVYNNPIQYVDPDGRAPYPVITITKMKTGKTVDQRVLGHSGGITTQADLYKAVITDTEDPSFRKEFSVTRDAWAVEAGNTYASNVAFEPKFADKNRYTGKFLPNGYPQGNGTEAIKLFQDGSQVMHAAPSKASVNLGYRSKSDVAAGIMLHVGGNYTKKSFGSRIAASEGCFGVCNTGNSSSNPSNSFTNDIMNTILDQANKSVTNPGRVDVVIEKREGSEFPTTKSLP